MSPTPRRQPGWVCDDCGTWNESTNIRCRNCQTSTPSEPQAEITQFEFPLTGQQVRTIMIDGEPWFVGKDAATILGYANPRKAVRDHVPARHRGGNDSFPLAELGLDPQTVLIAEPGLYRLIMRSNTALAEPFQDWVTDEVLPALRRTGRYDVVPRLSGDLLFELEQSNDRTSKAIEIAKAERARADAAEAELQVIAPAADAWQVLASADADYSVREAAYILNRDPAIDTGQNRLFNELRRLRVIDSRDIPYAGHAGHVKLRPRSFTNRATNEEMPAKPQVRITAEGLAYLHRKLGGAQPLQLNAVGGA